MKRILCFGDSNTWGYDPESNSRFGHGVRWPSVLMEKLGAEFHVIEEGLSGRTTVWDDSVEEFRSGKQYLVPCIESHTPLDLIIIMLGTNDLKKRFSLSAYDIAEGMGFLVNIIKKSCCGRGGKCPEILIISPPSIREKTAYRQMFEGAFEKSKQLPGEYQRVAEYYNCNMVDAGDVIVSGEVDGVHLDSGNHLRLGDYLCRWIDENLPEMDGAG